MKKFLSIILLVAMCLTMSIPAFASGIEPQSSSEEEFSLADATEILGVDAEELASMKI